MNNKIPALLLVLPLTLSACGFGGNNELAVDPQVSEFENIVSSGVNSELLSLALSSRNEDYCDQITDSQYSGNCKSLLADSIAVDEAVESGKLSDCEKIDNADYQTLCSARVNAQIQAQEEQAAFEREQAQVQELSSQAVTSGNLNLCNQISDTNQADGCRFNVIFNSTTSADCNVISSIELKAQCENLLEQR